MLSSHSIVSSSRTTRLCNPWVGRWVGHWKTTWSTVCSCNILEVTPQKVPRKLKTIMSLNFVKKIRKRLISSSGTPQPRNRVLRLCLRKEHADPRSRVRKSTFCPPLESSVEHELVSGSWFNQMLLFRTRSGLDWMSKTLYRIRYGYPNCVDHCSQMLNQSFSYMNQWCARVILLSQRQVITWSSQSESQELSSHFESLVCKLESMSSHMKFHIFSMTFLCYEIAPNAIKWAW